MATDEEYLDSLLKSLEESDRQETEGKSEETTKKSEEPQKAAAESEETGFADDFLAGLNDLQFDEEEPEKKQENLGNTGQTAGEAGQTSSENDAPEESWKMDLEALLGAVEKEEREEGGEETASDNPASDDMQSLQGGMENFGTDVIVPEQETFETEEPSAEEASAGKGKKEKKKKKKEPGRLMRLIQMLDEEMEEEEANASDENGTIIKELESEDLANAKKKRKEKKKKEALKKGRRKKGTGAKEGEEEEIAVKKKPAKRKKKEKLPKEKKEKPEIRKGPPVLSRKTALILTAFCATIVAFIVVSSMLIPDYIDKQLAREAFYDENYEEGYQLLYGKKLNDSDKIIFERMKLVLSLERKLEAARNNQALSKDAEALDSLLHGAAFYQELLSEDTFGAETELAAVYEQILQELSEDYGISEGDAMEINSYDSETYSRKVYSVAMGTEFTAPEIKEPAALQDVLPEEEELIEQEEETLEAENPEAGNPKEENLEAEDPEAENQNAENG